MNLVISQAEYTPETNLSADVITKLYNLAFVKVDGQTTLRQDAPTTLVGKVSLNSPTYKAYVDTFEDYYPHFHIDATAYYTLFEDPVVQQICATQWGDGIGVTDTQLANITNLNRLFSGNTNIVKFNELQYFTHIDAASGLGSRNFNGSNGLFEGCSNLEEVYIPSLITSIGHSAFSGCSKLRLINGGLHVFPGIASFGTAAFGNCSSLEGEFSFPDFTGNSLNATDYVGRPFSGCTKITKLSFGHTTTVGASNPYNWYNYPFHNLPALKIIDFGDSITAYGSYVFSSCVNIKAIIFRGTTPPTVSFANNNNTWGNSTSIIYVPTSAYATYLATSGFDTLYNAGRLKTIDEYTANESTILAN